MAVKKSFEAVNTALRAYAPNTTLATVLADPKFTSLMEAKKGGFSGVDSFVTINDNKVARICAMTGGVFAHDNTDKAISYFYKSGSYMIGAEVLKANARKAFDLQREDAEAELEDQMLEGVISPKEWKAKLTDLQKEVFEYHMTEDEKADLIETFAGYATKEAFTEAYNNEEVLPFSDFEDELQALRDLAPHRAEAETEDTEAEETEEA